MHQCKNAKETLELVDRDSAFDLILLDIEMPVMNGQEFFTELQKHELPIPIVFIIRYRRHTGGGSDIF